MNRWNRLFAGRRQCELHIRRQKTPDFLHRQAAGIVGKGKIMVCGRDIQAGSNSIHPAVLDPCFYQIRRRGEADSSGLCRHVWPQDIRLQSHIHSAPWSVAYGASCENNYCRFWVRCLEVHRNPHARGRNARLLVPSHSGCLAQDSELRSTERIQQKSSDIQFLSATHGNTIPANRICGAAVPSHGREPSASDHRQTPQLLQEPMDWKSSISNIFMECV